MRAFLLTSILLACTAQSQDLRPMTRAGPNGGALVAEAQELFPSMEQGVAAYTVLLPGEVRVDTLRWHERDFAVKGRAARRMHAAAKLDRPFESGAVYLPGAVHGLIPFVPEKRRIFFWGTDTLDVVLPYRDQQVRCVWIPNGYGERHLAVQVLDAQAKVRSARIHHVRRSECVAMQRDSIAVVRCPPDYRHADTEPTLVLVMVNGEAVQLWREPDHEKGRELRAVLNDAQRSALIFSTGEVLHHAHGTWRLEGAHRQEPGTQLVQER